MESIDKLRRISRMFDTWHFDDGDVIEVHYCTGQSDFYSVGDRIRRLLDEAEAEISERYMPLPLDADGIPCNVGDMLIHDGSEHEVLAVDTSCVWFYIARRTIALEPFPADECRHVKPRTIEDVLDDYRRELMETRACTLDDEMTDAEDEITARYADEIRGMQ